MTDPRERTEQPDIVERLRRVGHLDYHLMTEAADEIERLRQELAEARERTPNFYDDDDEPVGRVAGRCHHGNNA